VTTPDFKSEVPRSAAQNYARDLTPKVGSGDCRPFTRFPSYRSSDRRLGHDARQLEAPAFAPGEELVNGTPIDGAGVLVANGAIEEFLGREDGRLACPTHDVRQCDRSGRLNRNECLHGIDRIYHFRFFVEACFRGFWLRRWRGCSGTPARFL
jgi:hypothetical protein